MNLEAGHKEMISMAHLSNPASHPTNKELTMTTMRQRSDRKQAQARSYVDEHDKMNSVCVYSIKNH